MKLLLPEILHHFEKKDLLFCPAEDQPFAVPAKHKLRQAICNQLAPMMHRATKYIFDSGNDTDPETTMAVRQTAVNMLDAGLFHLPQPLIWIEDPFAYDPTTRNYYLCTETEEGITIYAIQSLPEPMRRMDGSGVRFILNANPIFIPLTEGGTDQFTVIGADGCGAVQSRNYAEICYSVKKFLVTLATAQVEREVVGGKPFKASLPKLYRTYDYQIVRIKAEKVIRVGDSKRKAPAGFVPYRKLVAGYMWGKHTRPTEEQRWIKPYWRYIDYPEKDEVKPDAPEKVYYVEPRPIKGGIAA